MFDLNGLVKQIGSKMLDDAIKELPTGVKFNLNPIRDLVLEHKKPNSIFDVVELTGKKYRREVMVFDDKNKNFVQY